VVVPPAESYFKRGGHVADLLYKTQGVRYRTKAVVLIEAVGRLVDSVDHDEPGGHSLCGDDNALKGIREEDTAEAPAVQRLIQGEPGEEDGRDMGRVAPPQRPRKVFPNEKVRSNRVISHDLPVLMPNERAAGSTCFRRAGVLPKPVVKVWLATVEGRSVVLFADRLADEGHWATAVLPRCGRDRRQP
jgi:hypothetical protein